MTLKEKGTKTFKIKKNKIVSKKIKLKEKTPLKLVQNPLSYSITEKLYFSKYFSNEELENRILQNLKNRKKNSENNKIGGNK